jgi:hypothetical protein
MFSRVKNWAMLAVTVLALAPVSAAKGGDILDVDLTLVDPSARQLFVNAEKFWEDRIAGYSSELPQVLRKQISALRISATVAPIDGEGGILGFAGPDGTLMYWKVTERPYVVAVTASMTFDLDDFASLEADGILQDVIIHEMGHAMGFGSMWGSVDATGVPTDLFPFSNQLIGPVGGVGQTEYLGQYGIQGYAMDTGNPLVTFVPIEQRGGPGTAFGHWNDMPPFFNQVNGLPPKKEILTGFACDLDPNGTGRLICAQKFLSKATLGAMADLGFAVSGFNGQFAVPRGPGRLDPWPKYTGAPGPILNFGPSAPDLSFRFFNRKISIKESLGSTGSGGSDTDTDFPEKDPYGLRRRNFSDQ